MLLLLEERLLKLLGLPFGPRARGPGCRREILVALRDRTHVLDPVGELREARCAEDGIELTPHPRVRGHGPLGQLPDRTRGLGIGRRLGPLDVDEPCVGGLELRESLVVLFDENVEASLKVSELRSCRLDLRLRWSRGRGGDAAGKGEDDDESGGREPQHPSPPPAHSPPVPAQKGWAP